jgi:hypothetical protein
LKRLRGILPSCGSISRKQHQPEQRHAAKCYKNDQSNTTSAIEAELPVSNVGDFVTRVFVSPALQNRLPLTLHVSHTAPRCAVQSPALS